MSFFLQDEMTFNELHWLVEQKYEPNTLWQIELSSIYFRQFPNKTWSPPQANSIPGFYLDFLADLGEPGAALFYYTTKLKFL